MMELTGSVAVDPWAGADRVDVAEAQAWIPGCLAALPRRATRLADALGLVLAGDVVAVERSPDFESTALDAALAIGPATWW